MILFLATFFTIYGSVHVYALLKARTAFGLGWAGGSALALFMIAMTAAPFLIRILERHGYDLPARALSYAAYLWMVALFLFFCSSLVIDLLNLLPRLVGLMINMDLSPLQARPKLHFFISLGLARRRKRLWLL